jgi:hypothetical protein
LDRLLHFDRLRRIRVGLKVGQQSVNTLPCGGGSFL